MAEMAIPSATPNKHMAIGMIFFDKRREASAIAHISSYGIGGKAFGIA